MSNKEKLAILEEILNVDEGLLNEELLLNEVAEWDSMAVISFIAMVDEKFDKIITTTIIKQFKTVHDVLSEME